MPFRVRETYKRNPVAIWDPGAGAHVIPDPARQYADDDPMVQAHGWYFIAEGETEDPLPESVRITDVVEQATRAPGEKRGGPIRTRTKKADK